VVYLQEKKPNGSDLFFRDENHGFISLLKPVLCPYHYSFKFCPHLRFSSWAINRAGKTAQGTCRSSDGESGLGCLNLVFWESKPKSIPVRDHLRCTRPTLKSLPKMVCSRFGSSSTSNRRSQTISSMPAPKWSTFDKSKVHRAKFRYAPSS